MAFRTRASVTRICANVLKIRVDSRDSRIILCVSLDTIICRLWSCLGLRAGRRLVDGLAQLVKASLKDVDLEQGRDDLAQAVVEHDDVEILVNVEGDAQNTF